MYFKLLFSEKADSEPYDIVDSGGTEIAEDSWKTWTQVFDDVGYIILSRNHYACEPLIISNKAVKKEYLSSALDPHFFQVISNKMLAVLYAFNLTHHSVFNPDILNDNKSVKDFSIYKINESIESWIDLDESEIDIEKYKSDQEILKNFDGFVRHKLYGNYIGINKPQLMFKKIVLKYGFDFDYFSIYDHSGGPIVSHRLMEALQAADIKGVSYEPMPEITVRQEPKAYIQPKITLPETGQAINSAPDLSHTAVRQLVDWIKSPLEFGKAPDGLVIIDERKLFWPTREVLDCYLMAYTVDSKNYVGLAGPTPWTFFGIDYSSLTMEELYLIYVGWYIATFTPPPETDHTIDKDPSLIELIDYMKGDGFHNPVCVQRINLNGVVYYEIHAEHAKGKSVIVGSDGDFNDTWEPKVLSLYEKIGQDWDPFAT
jgi:hypothetical protein